MPQALLRATDTRARTASRPDGLSSQSPGETARQSPVACRHQASQRPFPQLRKGLPDSVARTFVESADLDGRHVARHNGSAEDAGCRSPAAAMRTPAFLNHASSGDSFRPFSCSCAAPLRSRLPNGAMIRIGGRGRVLPAVQSNAEVRRPKATKPVRRISSYSSPFPLPGTLRPAPKNENQKMHEGPKRHGRRGRPG